MANQAMLSTRPMMASAVATQHHVLALSEARGRFIVEAAAGGELGTMLAVAAERSRVEALLAGLPGITCAEPAFALRTHAMQHSFAKAHLLGTQEIFELRGVERTIEARTRHQSPRVEIAQQC